ncbi:hypothetical protein D3C85_964440 [compost metagenome]
MAIDWPAALWPSQMTWGMVYNNRAFTSTLSNAQQILGYPGGYWLCALSFEGLYDEDERVVTALLGRLQGMYGTVNIPAFTRRRADDIGSQVVVTANAQATEWRRTRRCSRLATTSASRERCLRWSMTPRQMHRVG